MENTNIRTWKILDENQDTIRLVEITFFDEEANIRKIALFTETGILFEWTPDMYRIKAIDDSYGYNQSKSIWITHNGRCSRRAY